MELDVADDTQELPTGFGAVLLFILSPLTLVGLLWLVRDGASIDLRLIVGIVVSVMVNVYVAYKLIAHWRRKRS